MGMNRIMSSYLCLLSICRRPSMTSFEWWLRRVQAAGACAPAQLSSACFEKGHRGGHTTIECTSLGSSSVLIWGLCSPHSQRTPRDTWTLWLAWNMKEDYRRYKGQQPRLISEPDSMLDDEVQNFKVIKEIKFQKCEHFRYQLNYFPLWSGWWVSIIALLCLGLLLQGESTESKRLEVNRNTFPWTPTNRAIPRCCNLRKRCWSADVIS